MAKLPIVTALNRQDFPEAPAWVSKLLYPLQLFMTAVTSALSNRLTLQDNLSCVIQDASILAGAADTDNVLQFNCSLGRQIAELSIYCTNADGSYSPIYPQVSWNYINGQVVINGIKGLTSGKKYNLRLVVK